MELTNPSLSLIFGQPIAAYSPTFDAPHPLQGLGCSGDDGTIHYLGLPAGLTFNPIDGEITGTPQEFGLFNVTMELVGTDELCEYPMVYHSFVLSLSIARLGFVFSKNFITDSFLVPSNGKLLCTLWVETAFLQNDFQALGTFEHNGDSTGAALLLVQNELDALLESEKLKAGVGPLALWQQVIIRQFKLSVLALASDGSQVDSYETPPRFVLLGGLSTLDYHHETAFLDNLIALGGWLQYAEPKTISPLQPEYLFALCAKNSVLVLTYHQSDGSSSQHIKGGFKYLCVPILEQANAQTVRITAQMRRNGVLYGTARNYLIDRIEQPHERFVLFRNTKGTMETVRCTGELSSEVEAAEKVVSERMMRPAMHLSMSQDFVWKTGTAKHKHSLATGWLSVDYRQYLAGELMETNEVYMFDASHQELIPVLLQSKKMDSFQDNEYRFGLVLEYTEAI